jgi:hypothetical protein
MIGAIYICIELVVDFLWGLFEDYEAKKIRKQQRNEKKQEKVLNFLKTDETKK